MNMQVPEQATGEQLETWLKNIGEKATENMNLSFQVSMAAMGYLGMCRYKAMTPNWIAHNSLWAGTINTIGRMLDPSTSVDRASAPIRKQIISTFEKLGYTPNDVAK